MVWGWDQLLRSGTRWAGVRAKLGVDMATFAEAYGGQVALRRRESGQGGNPAAQSARVEQ